MPHRWWPGAQAVEAVEVGHRLWSRVRRAVQRDRKSAAIRQAAHPVHAC